MQLRHAQRVGAVVGGEAATEGGAGGGAVVGGKAATEGGTGGYERCKGWKYRSIIRMKNNRTAIPIGKIRIQSNGTCRLISPDVEVTGCVLEGVD
jgi:hypothetical protein